MVSGLHPFKIMTGHCIYKVILLHMDVRLGMMEKGEDMIASDAIKQEWGVTPVQWICRDIKLICQQLE